ncbi:MAG: peptide ABC transporter substrate-binding protein, partial [Oscillospiraceae bacterium]|nr:peptide ABC transporter substrate-binding protein [Oscillospiraceae bacterium]
MKKIISVLCACSLLLLSACNQDAEEIIMNDDVSSTVESGNVFRMYYPAEVSTLNYLKTNTYNETYLSANMIDCLVEYDCYGNVLPCLAESWEHNEDMTEWTFHIRQGVEWMDYQGNVYDEVIADDWVASAEYVNNAKNESDCQYMYASGSIIRNAQAYYDYTAWDNSNPEGKGDGPPDNPQEKNIQETTMQEVLASDIGVSAPDDYTLVYTLEQPCPFFLSVLGYSSYMPVCRKYLEETGDMFGRDNKNLLYNGAYLLSTWIPQEKQILTRNPAYWDSENVFIDRVERE